MDSLISLLLDGGKMYDPLALSELTKSEISERLMLLQVRKAELEQQGMKPLNPDPNEAAASAAPGEPQQAAGSVAMAASGNGLDMVNEAIYTLGEMQKTAPDEKKFVEASEELETRDITAGMSEDERRQYEGKLFEVAQAGQLNPQGGMRSVFAVNNEPSNSYLIEYVNRGDFDVSTGMYFSEDEWADMQDTLANAEEQEALNAMPAPSITPDEARDIAERFLEQMGIDYLTCERSESVVGGSSSFYGDGLRTGNLIKAYRLHYVRKLSGVPVTYTYIETTANTDGDIIWNWAYEGMTFIIDDSGIVEMKWEAPYRLRETLTDNAALLPFSHIQGVFEKMIIIGNSYYMETGADMNITEARLGLMRIYEQNNTSSGLLIPVWDFFGTLTTYSEAGEAYIQKQTGLVWLTVNAVDGTVIDRSLGY